MEQSLLKALGNLDTINQYLIKAIEKWEEAQGTIKAKWLNWSSVYGNFKSSFPTIEFVFCQESNIAISVAIKKQSLPSISNGQNSAVLQFARENAKLYYQLLDDGFIGIWFIPSYLKLEGKDDYLTSCNPIFIEKFDINSLGRRDIEQDVQVFTTKTLECKQDAKSQFPKIIDF